MGGVGVVVVVEVDSSSRVEREVQLLAVSSNRGNLFRLGLTDLKGVFSRSSK